MHVWVPEKLSFHYLNNRINGCGAARWRPALVWCRQRPRLRRPRARSTSQSIWTAARLGLSSRVRPHGWPRGCAPSRPPGSPPSRAARQPIYHRSRHIPHSFSVAPLSFGTLAFPMSFAAGQCGDGLAHFKAGWLPSEERFLLPDPGVFLLQFYEYVLQFRPPCST